MSAAILRHRPKRASQTTLLKSSTRSQQQNRNHSLINTQILQTSSVLNRRSQEAGVQVPAEVKPWRPDVRLASGRIQHHNLPTAQGSEKLLALSQPQIVHLQNKKTTTMSLGGLCTHRCQRSTLILPVPGTGCFRCSGVTRERFTK